MVNIRPIIQARIRAQVAAFKDVSGAAGMADIIKNRLADPGCYVFQERVTPSNNQSATGVVQSVSIAMAAVIVVRNVRDARGEDAADASFDLQAAVNAALLNWSPDADYEALRYTGGALISFSGGFHIWKDSYTTQTFIQG